MTPPDRAQVTGLVLAGGRGRRMGGVDKGLQPLGGRPLAGLALQRLAQQVAACLVSANRHVDDYARFGVPVLSDADPGHPGPLAGMLAGLSHTTTDWLAVVPCDSPSFPLDLVARLSAGLGKHRIAMAATRVDGGRLQHQPVFCLLHRSLAPSLAAFMAEGGKSPWAWASQEAVSLVPFDDADSFANANTLEDLQRLG